MFAIEVPLQRVVLVTFRLLTKCITNRNLEQQKFSEDAM